jgi:four helix bundle protein
MSRDPRRLPAFAMADALVIDVYCETRGFPTDERFGLRSQIRRAAISVTANLVEGSARRTVADYVHFVAISIGSASEARYLIDVARRLGFVEAEAAHALVTGYDRVIRALQALVSALSGRGPRPEARGPEQRP